MDERPVVGSLTVAVYGASGHTGAFVIRELERRGFPSIAIGRSVPTEAGGVRTQWRIASCDDPDALDRALEGSVAVINCAGPFLDTAPALIEAALRAGIHYLDITAEQRSVRQSLATYDDEARERGCAIVPAMAFYGGLADLLATAVTRGMESVDEIEIGVALDSWHPTEGTRKTGERNTARRLVISDGRLMPISRPAPEKLWSFPEPFGNQDVIAVPLSEIVTINRHIAVRTVCSYMNLAPLRDLNDADTPSPSASDASGRSSQRFVMDVRATSSERREQIAVEGFDIYAVTAPIVVEACSRILKQPPIGGTYSPGELFDASHFLGALSPHVTIVQESKTS